MSYVISLKQTKVTETSETLKIETEIEVNVKVATVELIKAAKVTQIAEFGKRAKIEGLDNIRGYGSVIKKLIEKKVEEDFPTTEKLNEFKARVEAAAENTQGGGEEPAPVTDNSETRDIGPQAVEEVTETTEIVEAGESIETEPTEKVEETAPKPKKKK